MRDLPSREEGSQASSSHSSPDRSKNLLFLLSLLHAAPSTFFLYGEPFYAHRRFGWSTDQIALSQALSGLCIAVGAYLGGQIAHHTRPYVNVLLGMLLCLVASVVGWMGDLRGDSGSLLWALGLFGFAQAMTWPGIETALMEDEPPARISHFVGYFNLIWSLGTASAFLASTPLMHALGLRVLFVLPAAFYAVMSVFGFFVLPRRLRACTVEVSEGSDDAPPEPDLQTEQDRVIARRLSSRQRAAFRWLGWLANPLGYVAINVVVAFNPATQARLHLDFAATSIWFSLWFYVRTAAFELLRRWTWWHYRQRFLCFAYAGAMAGFCGIVFAPNLPVLMVAQALFGLCVGLLYQSSLFYSMAESEAQGAHGGFHECFIGLGLMLGPLLAFGGAHGLPGVPAAPIYAVLALMTAGLVGLIAIGRQTEAGRPKQG